MARRPENLHDAVGVYLRQTMDETGVRTIWAQRLSYIRKFRNWYSIGLVSYRLVPNPAGLTAITCDADYERLIIGNPNFDLHPLGHSSKDTPAFLAEVRTRECMATVSTCKSST